VFSGFRTHFLFWVKTMELTTIAGRIEKIAAEAAAKCGVEFVHAEVVGTKRNMTVRVYVDKPEGVTLDDCSTVSRAIEEVIDADDFIPAAYVLEVSSPGLERGLYTIKDFEKFAGKRAKVKTSAAIEAQTNFNGRITSVEDGEIIFDDKTKGPVRIPFESIVKANLRVDLAEEFKKR
jgi:ribosome maturation factor RimP